MTNRLWKPTRTPTPTPSFRAMLPSPHLAHGFVKWVAGFLLQKGMDVGPIGQQVLGEYFACGKTQPGKMRLELRKLVALLEGKESTLLVHTVRQADYRSTTDEAAALLGEVEKGVEQALVARRHEDRLSVLELGMLAGVFYSRNRNGNDPSLMTFLDAIGHRLRGKLANPVELYIGGGVAFRQRSTVANIGDYVESVARKFGISSPDQRLTLSSQIALLVMGRGQSFERTEQNIIFWLNKAGYNIEETADFLAGLVREMDYDTAQTARLVAEVAKKKNYTTPETKSVLSTRVMSVLKYPAPQMAQFTGWLAKHGYFEQKRG